MQVDIRDLRLATAFLNRTPKAQATKENINLTPENLGHLSFRGHYQKN